MDDARLKQTNMILDFDQAVTSPGGYPQLTVGQLVDAFKDVPPETPVNVYYYDDTDGGSRLESVEQNIFSDGSQTIWLRQT